jgi:hypothetical protein
MAKKGSKKMSATPVPASSSIKKPGSGIGTGANPLGYATGGKQKGGKTPGLQGKSCKM